MFLPHGPHHVCTTNELKQRDNKYTQTRPKSLFENAVINVPEIICIRFNVNELPI